MEEFVAAGRVVAADQVRTSAEGVAVKRPGDLTFALLNEFLDDLSPSPSVTSTR